MIVRVWRVEFTDEFAEWWQAVPEAARDRIDSIVRLLESHGPHLGAPRSSKIFGARHGNLRELRIQVGGRAFRVLYAFDPRQVAILLNGGDKSNDSRFYESMIPRADALYATHLRTLMEEGLL